MQNQFLREKVIVCLQQIFLGMNNWGVLPPGAPRWLRTCLQTCTACLTIRHCALVYIKTICGKNLLMHFIFHPSQHLRFVLLQLYRNRPKRSRQSQPSKFKRSNPCSNKSSSSSVSCVARLLHLYFARVCFSVHCCFLPAVQSSNTGAAEKPSFVEQLRDVTVADGSTDFKISCRVAGE